MIIVPHFGTDSQAMPQQGGLIQAAQVLPKKDLRQQVTVKSGDTLTAVLSRGGASQDEAHEAANVIAEMFDPRDLRPGHELTLHFNNPAAGGGMILKRASFEPGPGREVVASRGEAGAFVGSESKAPLRHMLVRSEAVIETSLYEAAEQAGIPANLLAEVVRAYSYDVDFQRDIQPGDSFEILFDRSVTPKGETVRDGSVIYTALTLSGKKLALYRYTDSSGVADYYTEKGESVRKALLKTPIDGARLSSGFGLRKHPILGYTRMHRGVDFAAATGTPIFAAGDGMVDHAGANGSYGTYVRIRHNGAFSTAYAHLNHLAKGLRNGKMVRQGQVIGYVGTTGSSTGPHLHFEVIKSGEQVNPVNVKFASGKAFTGKELARFTGARNKIKAQFAQTPSSPDEENVSAAK